VDGLVQGEEVAQRLRDADQHERGTQPQIRAVLQQLRHVPPGIRGGKAVELVHEDEHLAEPDAFESHGGRVNVPFRRMIRLCFLLRIGADPVQVTRRYLAHDGGDQVGEAAARRAGVSHHAIARILGQAGDDVGERGLAMAALAEDGDVGALGFHGGDGALDLRPAADQGRAGLYWLRGREGRADGVRLGERVGVVGGLLPGERGTAGDHGGVRLWRIGAPERDGWRDWRRVWGRHGLLLWHGHLRLGGGWFRTRPSEPSADHGLVNRRAALVATNLTLS
jgi:hypothetical protein